MKSLLFTLALGLGLSAYAGTYVTPSTTAEPDTAACAKNTKFYKIYLKSKNYVDAYTFWKRVYDECPAQSKDLYIQGAEIYTWQIDNAKTPEDKKKAYEGLMEMYNSRIKYFGDDEETGEDYILGSMISDQLKYYPGEVDYVKMYDRLKPVIDKRGAKTDPLTLYYFTYSSMLRSSLDQSFKAQYVKDQTFVDKLYAEAKAAAEAEGNTSRAESIASYQATSLQAFAASGAASCDVMESIYGPQIKEKNTDKTFLKETIALFQSVGCTESPSYYAASEAMFNLEPSSSAALGVARKALADKNYTKAEEYYKKAIDLSTDADEKGEANYALAVMYYDRHSYGTSRQYCNAAMAAKPGFGAPMLLIASMYASTASSIYPDDPVKQRVVYCLVVDKAARAKAIDPSVTAQANKLIGTYSAAYPAKEDIFMHPDLQEGQSFTVGGWIGETTTIRVR